MGPRRWAAALPLAAAMLAAPAGAATFTVTTTADTTACAPGACSLRGAIIAANASAGADTISLPGGTFALALGPDEVVDAANATLGDLDLTGPVTITGAGRDATVVSGAEAVRVFQVHGSPAAFRGLTIAHGRVGDLEQRGGAGLQARGGARVTLDDVDVRDNRAASVQADAAACLPPDALPALAGGGILSLGGDTSITLRRSVIEGNRVEDDVPNGDCNRAPRGGGISIGGGSVLLEDSIVRDNAAIVHVAPGSTAGSVNGATGGAISIEAQNPGSVNPAHPNPLSPDTAAGTDCGGFSRGTPVLTLRRSAVVGNRAAGGSTSTGGAIAMSGVYYCGPFSDMTLESSSVIGNTSDGYTPGIATTRGNLKITAVQSTIAANVGGGGGYSQVAVAADPWDNGMEAIFTGSIVEAGPAGAEACSNAPDTVDHGPPTPANPYAYPRYTSGGGNVIAGTCALRNATGSDALVAAGGALLGPLGGELVPSMAPLAASPAINRTGACSFLLDGRGYPRPLGGGCDAGAAERQVGIANLAGPTITGVPALGTTVGVMPGSWTTHRGTTSYRWLRCPLAGTCTDTGASGATYAPSAVDVGNQLQVVVTAASDDDPATAAATSPRSGPVLAAPPSPLGPAGPPATVKPKAKAKAAVTALASGCAAHARRCAPSVVFRLTRAVRVRISIAQGRRVVYRRSLGAKAGRNRAALPAGLAPGRYTVTVLPVGGRARSVTITVARRR